MTNVTHESTARNGSTWSSRTIYPSAGTCDMDLPIRRNLHRSGTPKTLVPPRFSLARARPPLDPPSLERSRQRLPAPLTFRFHLQERRIRKPHRQAARRLVAEIRKAGQTRSTRSEELTFAGNAAVLVDAGDGAGNPPRTGRRRRRPAAKPSGAPGGPLQRAPAQRTSTLSRAGGPPKGPPDRHFPEACHALANER